ncbi:putative suppressor of disruption of TFIIS [Friedmanniomyces endolithicus]|nr:putative suppressor of disruption of TFIIS [Friedmanniomyces endolithicus]
MRLAGLFASEMTATGANSASNGTSISKPGNGISNGKQNQKTFFLDIDNCLYPKSYRIHEMMGELIDEYFQTHLSLSKQDAFTLHQRYYKDYGLAIEGLVRFHKVDPLEYNEKVDDALALDQVIKPDPKLQRLLGDIDRSQVKLWLFTNAYITHGQRVVRLLGVEDCFDGITYCDYGAEKLLCKPRREMYDKAMQDSGTTDISQCYFVDDNALNARAGTEYGWESAHLVEPSVKAPEQSVSDFQIRSLEELRQVFPELFRHGSAA